MPATPLTERPLLEGWVLKQSKHVKVYRHRWLVLTPTRLLSYRTKRAYAEAGGAVPTETFDVDMLQLVRPVDEDNCSSLIIHTSDGDGATETRLLMLAFVGGGGSGGGGAAAGAAASSTSSSPSPAAPVKPPSWCHSGDKLSNSPLQLAMGERSRGEVKS